MVCNWFSCIYTGVLSPVYCFFETIPSCISQYGVKLARTPTFDAVIFYGYGLETLE